MELIDIKDISGTLLLTTIINEGSKRKFMLMKEDYIMLKFSLEEPIYFKLGDYVEDSRFGRFEICDIQKPRFNSSTAGYDYELKLDAHYWKWKNKIFKFTPEVGGQEASWNLTASLDTQLGVFLRNLQALGYTYKGTNFEFSIDSSVENKSMLMSYDNTNLLDALSKMAETWDCEWWVEDNQIRFGRCEFGDPVDFEIGKNVEEMTRSDSKTEYATRIYAFGSTRNLPTNYRPVDESVVVNGVVQKRLMLPVGTPYIDAYPGMRTEEAIEQVVVFDDIYPRRIGTMSDITTHEYTNKIENADGTTTEEKWDAYRFNDSGIVFSKDYVLPGEELKITFQSGSLNGMTFAVTFNPCDKEGGEEEIPEKLEDGSWNPAAQVWEIVRNDDYGRNLPGDVLIPENGDTYVLSGFDTKFVSVQMLPDAEQELKEKAEKYIAKTQIDPSTYDAKMNPSYMFGINPETGEEDENFKKHFAAGDRVNLINQAYFENGRQSRIIGFEYNLDIPWDHPVYTVGETASYSRISDLEDKVDSLTLKGQTYTGGGGSGVYVIGTNDSTVPTNRNVFSALKSLYTFIRKDIDDIVKVFLTFWKGIKIGKKFIPGWIGSGGAFYVDEKTGKTRLEVDEVLARDRFETMEYRFNRIDVIDGEQWSTFAFGKIKSVDVENQIAYLDLVDGELMSSHVGDINRGMFHNLKGDNATGEIVDGSGFKTIVGFSTSYFTPTELLADGSGFKYALKPGTTTHPCAEMKFVAYGNFTDKTRQSSTYTTRTLLVMLSGVDTWNISPERHYTYVRGDLNGLEFDGITFEGDGVIQGNSYIYGSTIKFTKEQLEDLKGESGYSVMLSTYDAIVNVDEFGRLDSSVYDIINVVNGEELVYSGSSQVVVNRYTDIQVAKGKLALEYADLPTEGKYSVTYETAGCECVISGGRVTVTKLTEDKASVNLHVNCEGMITFDQTLYITRVYSGESAFMVNLTSDTDAIACNAEGAPIATGVLAESTAELYFANVKQTEGVSFKYTPLNCTISELQNTTGKIEVTGITQDTASVDVAVSYKSKTLYITYSLLKVKGTVQACPVLRCH